MKIPKSEEPDYPVVGNPMETIKSRGDALKITYRGHIILERGSGIFVEPDFEVESDALENSAQLVVDMRKTGKSKGI